MAPRSSDPVLTLKRQNVSILAQQGAFRRLSAAYYKYSMYHIMAPGMNNVELPKIQSPW